MLTVMFSMLVFALIGAISPGPVNIIATSSGANFGFIRTLPHVLGATLGYTLIVLLVGMGLKEVLLRQPQLTGALQYLGAAFLLWMAYRLASTTRGQTEPQPLRSEPPRFIEGALVQLLNPKAWLVSMSGITLFVSAYAPAGAYLAMFCAVSFAMCLLGVGTWAALGTLLGRWLARPGYQAGFNLFMGLLLSGTVVALFIH